VRPLVLGLSCLILGFVAGWVLHGSGDSQTALPSASVDVTVAQPPPRTTSVPTEAPPPARSQVSLLVLNGTGQAGLAAKTAARAGGLGYQNVGATNAPAGTFQTTVYFRSGQRTAAAEVARDLGYAASTLQALPPAGPVRQVVDRAQPGAAVVVLLGAG